MEKRWKNGAKGEIFAVNEGKNIIFEKGGWAKISYFGQIYSPGQVIDKLYKNGSICK